MKYDARVIPEGINSSPENPLKEMAILVSSVVAIIALLVFLIAFVADYLIAQISPAAENEWFSEQRIEQFLIDADRPDSPAIKPAEDYLLDLINRLKTDAYDEYRFSITIYEDTTPNALIVPGGHIFVSSALFDYIDSENGLAMVLAHEMAHQYYRHPLRSTGRGLIMLLAASVLLGQDDSAWLQSMILEGFNLGQMAFSREQESAADRLAVESLRQYYGHTRGASEFFERIRVEPHLQDERPRFYRSHPGTNDRITFLEEYSRDDQGVKTALPPVVRVLQDTSHSKPE